MALEDLFERAFAAGANRVVVYDEYEDDDTDEVAWFWEIHRGDPVKWFSIIKPWTIGLQWLGFGSNPGKALGLLPFEMAFCEVWRIGLYVGSQRSGCQGSVPKSLEDGLRAALGSFLCDGEGPNCPHTICEFHSTCADRLRNAAER